MISDNLVCLRLEEARFYSLSGPVKNDGSDDYKIKWDAGRKS